MSKEPNQQNGFVNLVFQSNENTAEELPRYEEKKFPILAENELKKIEDSKVTKTRRFFTHLKGTFIAVLSALSVSLGGIFYKKAVTMTGSDNSVYRYVSQFIIMIVLLIIKREPILGPKEQRKLLMLRSFFGIFAVVSTNFAIKYIDPSDNSALSHTNLIITAVLARIYLKEKFNISHLISLIFLVAGIIFITKPAFIFPKKIKFTNSTNGTNGFCDIVPNTVISEDTLSKIVGVSLALVGAFGSAAIYVVIRKFCVEKVYFGVNTLYGTFLGLPVCVIISGVLIGTKSSHKDFKCELQNYPYDILYGVIGGLFALLGHVLLNIALQYEDATKVSMIRTVELIF